MKNCIITRDAADGTRYWNGMECWYDQHAILFTREQADAELAGIESLDYRKAEGWRIVELAPPLFYYNGIRDTKRAPIQRCLYSRAGTYNAPGLRCDETITIYARDYRRFSAAVRAHFAVENNSDTMTDYFEQDRIRVRPDHPLYPQVKAAMEASEASRERRAQAMAERRASARAA